MGRLNALVANNSLGDGTNIGEKATLATQRHLIQLRKVDKTKSLLIGASMRDGSQVLSLAGLDVFTMPPKVAADFNNNPGENVSYAINNDPSINLSEGISFEDFNATTLWDVPEEFKACVDELLKKDIDGLTPGDIQSHFDDAGFGDLFPRWTNEDMQTITNDGKIPVYDKWKDRLSTGQIGLDAIMNISAFYSFAKDQKALDERIKSLL
jgi:transaldolase